jgi:hypothetical protein
MPPSVRRGITISPADGLTPPLLPHLPRPAPEHRLLRDLDPKAPGPQVAKLGPDLCTGAPLDGRRVLRRRDAPDRKAPAPPYRKGADADRRSRGQRASEQTCPEQSLSYRVTATVHYEGTDCSNLP